MQCCKTQWIQFLVALANLIRLQAKPLYVKYGIMIIAGKNHWA